MRSVPTTFTSSNVARPTNRSQPTAVWSTKSARSWAKPRDASALRAVAISDKLEAMKHRWILPGWLVATLVFSAGALAQSGSYPITVIPPGKGPYEFPAGYQTPWDKIRMMVTEKVAANVY